MCSETKDDGGFEKEGKYQNIVQWMINKQSALLQVVKQEPNFLKFPPILILLSQNKKPCNLLIAEHSGGEAGI